MIFVAPGVPFLDYVLGRIGFFRLPPPPAPPPPRRELVIFKHKGAAFDAGFHSTRHAIDPYVEAWWPARGVRGLLGRPPQRVTIPRVMTYHQTSEGSLVEILRKRQMIYGDRAIWIEV